MPGAEQAEGSVAVAHALSYSNREELRVRVAGRAKAAFGRAECCMSQRNCDERAATMLLGLNQMDHWLYESASESDSRCGPGAPANRGDGVLRSPWTVRGLERPTSTVAVYGTTDFC